MIFVAFHSFLVGFWLGDPAAFAAHLTEIARQLGNELALIASRTAQVWLDLYSWRFRSAITKRR
ncbi:hypothetical protein [Nocardia sp. alder85J]|uniref:hypothetical protein n=1 Tax=Nocardia sp. alder85J TaxID=2862949 RepID=UPI001CD37010|nr:hypothetical protein [Nocardia sp. alder85J]MCX4092553.1 hypothetical protein [Nocardia sp. alder85J]